jgi:DNA-binding transcriptional LysR family regulator
MNVKQIKALQLLAKTGSVSATARLLNLSQSAISKMIRALETEMGIPLLNHVRGKIQLRSELDTLLPSIERVTQDLSDLRALMDDIRAGITGSLTISCSTTVGMSLVLPACRNLLARKPTLRPTLVARGGRFSVDDVISNRVDLAVEQLVMMRPKLESCAVAKSTMVCVMPKGHALARKKQVRATDLHRQRVVLYPTKTINGGRVHNLLRDQGADYDPIFFTDSAVLACQLVQQLSVVGIIDSCMDVSHLFPALEVRPFVPRIEFELHAMWKAQKMRPALKELIDELAQVGRHLG